MRIKQSEVERRYGTRLFWVLVKTLGLNKFYSVFPGLKKNSKKSKPRTTIGYPYSIYEGLSLFIMYHPSLDVSRHSLLINVFVSSHLK